jgi:hypothetical protein
MALPSDSAALRAALREAGMKQACLAADYRRHTPRRVRELLAERVAANPGVASLPAHSLVRVAVRLAQYGADYGVVTRQFDRGFRFNDLNTPPPPELAAAVAEKGMAVMQLPSDDMPRLLPQAFELLPPLRTVTGALQTCVAQGGGRLRAATRDELAFFIAERRLRNHGDALLQRSAWDAMAREAAVDVALELGGRAMEVWGFWGSLCGVVRTDTDTHGKPGAGVSCFAGSDGVGMRLFEPCFSAAADAVHLALCCAMQPQQEEEGGAPPTPARSSWFHAGVILSAWTKLEAYAAMSAMLHQSPSMRTMRATLAHGGAAMTFLLATRATRPTRRAEDEAAEMTAATLRRRCGDAATHRRAP